MNSPCRIFLADDHAVVRDGIKAIIDAQTDMRVVGVADGGESAVERCRVLQPDIIITDITMDGINAVELIKTFIEICPRSKTLVLSMHESAAYLRQMLEAGASGYVAKRSAGEELLHGIRSVATGGTYIDPKIAEKLAATLRTTTKGTLVATAALSEREVEVIKMTAQGQSSKEIAATLNIGKKSVDTYKARAMQKLGLQSRSDIFRYAMGQNWLQ